MLGRPQQVRYGGDKAHQAPSGPFALVEGALVVCDTQLAEALHQSAVTSEMPTGEPGSSLRCSPLLIALPLHHLESKGW